MIQELLIYPLNLMFSINTIREYVCKIFCNIIQRFYNNKSYFED